AMAPYAGKLRARATLLSSRFRAMPRPAQIAASVAFAALLVVLALSTGGEGEHDEPAPPVKSAAKKPEAPAAKRPAASTKREEPKKSSLAEVIEALTRGESRSERLEAARTLEASEES